MLYRSTSIECTWPKVQFQHIKYVQYIEANISAYETHHHSFDSS